MSEHCYSSPSCEDISDFDAKLSSLRKKRPKILDFCRKIRYGHVDLFKASKSQIEKYLQLLEIGAIKNSFALMNPKLFSADLQDADGRALRFVFIRVAPTHYFIVKDKIEEFCENYQFSAYTTLGVYDFVIRMLGSEHDEKNIEEILHSFKIRRDTPVGGGTEADGIGGYKIGKINQVLGYDKINDFPRLSSLDILTQEERMLFEQIHVEIDNDNLANSKKIYKSLVDKKVVLGTRCIVDSPKLRETVTFILAKGQDSLPIHNKLLGNHNLSSHVVDVFSIEGFTPYTTLIVCEFPCLGYCSWLSYNQWMDNFYRYINCQCLTFPSDSTITEHSDTLSPLASYKKDIDTHFSQSSERKICLGNSLYYGTELAPVCLNPSFFYGHGVIIGGSGSGKTNTCLHILKEINNLEINSIFIGLKSKNTVREEEIEIIGGKSLSYDDFLSIDRIEEIPKGISVVQVDVGKKGLEIANHCFDLLSNVPHAGVQKDLNTLIIIDEIINLVDNMKDNTLLGRLSSAMNLIREPGIGLLITHQTVALLDKIPGCKFSLFHKQHNGKMAEELLGGFVLGLKSPLSKSIENLGAGMSILKVNEDVPGIVIQFPQIKE